MNKQIDRKSALMSVEQIIDATTNVNSWKLSIAQRAFEWDKIRVINLVDSLLRGFPIGSLLVMDSKDSFYEIDGKSKFRKEHESISEFEKTHIIDGQQRCVAINAAFNGEGYFDKDEEIIKHLFINISSDNKAVKEFNEKINQKYYYHWSAKSNINNLNEAERKHEKFMSRSPQKGWVEFKDMVQLIQGNLILEQIKNKACIDEINEIVFGSISNSIMSALTSKTIPVHFLNDDHKELEDIFHVFIRINTGGLPLSGVDVFFTGIKKEWHDAEEHLAPIVNKESLLTRSSAITCLARCASKSLDKPFDPVNVRLQHIRYSEKDGNYPLIIKMRELAPIDVDTPFIEAVRWVTKVARKHLYSAADTINRFYLMTVIAWAFQYRQKKEFPGIDDMSFIKPIISYLFWTSVFNPMAIGQGRFHRDTLTLAWNSGANSDVFPFDDNRMQVLCFNYSKIRENKPLNPYPDRLSKHKDDPEYQNSIRILNIASGNDNMLLFLTVFQKIQHKPIDLDHLIADNYARQRFRRGRETLMNYLTLVRYIGNFSIIASSANRHFQDKPPTYKFNSQEGCKETYHNKGFIKTEHCVSAEEMSTCFEIQKLLDNKQQVEGGDLLGVFIEERSLRIWKSVLEVVGYPMFLLPPEEKQV
jgi:hypothetical protein